MNDGDTRKAEQQLREWVQNQLNIASEQIGQSGLIDGPLIDVKPEWTLPFSLLVGRARAHRDPAAFKWFICGEVPLDCIDGAVAENPRGAIRHFAIKWQLDADKASSPERSRQLIHLAESLYPLAEDERLWQPRGAAGDRR
jgi:hypothetical protein